jgi:hypothetical protein
MLLPSSQAPRLDAENPSTRELWSTQLVRVCSSSTHDKPDSKLPPRICSSALTHHIFFLLPSCFSVLSCSRIQPATSGSSRLCAQTSDFALRSGRRPTHASLTKQRASCGKRLHWGSRVPQFAPGRPAYLLQQGWETGNKVACSRFILHRCWDSYDQQPGFLQLEPHGAWSCEWDVTSQAPQTIYVLCLPCRNT